jgi:hypothetical protein
MRSEVFAALLFASILSVSVSVYATDLPIDISAIGRQNQGNLGGSVMPRIGANLFTDDADRVNELLLNQVRHRQETSTQLFGAVSLYHTADPQAQILSAADGLGLFAQPTGYSNFTASQEASQMPVWLTVLIFVTCAVLGFVLALISRARRARRTEDA